MVFVKRSIQNQDDLRLLPETFLRGDALVALQPDLANKDRFEVVLDANLLSKRHQGDQPTVSLMHPSRHTTHLRAMFHAPKQRFTVLVAHKNATHNPHLMRNAPKLVDLVFKDGIVRDDPLKRTAITFAGRAGKGTGFVTMSGLSAMPLNLPGEWAHAEFTATEDALFAFMPGSHRLYVASFEQIEEAAMTKINVRWDIAFESKLPLDRASRQIGKGFVLNTATNTTPRAMSAQGFAPVCYGRGQFKLTPATQVIPTGNPGAEMIDGLTLAPDGQELLIAFRSLSDSDKEAPLPKFAPFKDKGAEGWRNIIESLGGLPG